MSKVCTPNDHVYLNQSGADHTPPSGTRCQCGDVAYFSYAATAPVTEPQERPLVCCCHYGDPTTPCPIHPPTPKLWTAEQRFLFATDTDTLEDAEREVARLYAAVSTIPAQPETPLQEALRHAKQDHAGLLARVKKQPETAAPGERVETEGRERALGDAEELLRRCRDEQLPSRLNADVEMFLDRLAESRR